MDKKALSDTMLLRWTTGNVRHI